MRHLTTLFVMAALAAPSLASAGPWVRDLGHGFAKIGTTRFVSDNGFVDGESTGLAYRSQSFDTYFEVGLGRGIQVVGSLPFVAATNKASGDVAWNYAWTGDLRFEIDGRLHPSKPIAWGVELRVPTYRDPVDFNEAKGMSSELLAATARNFPQLGDTNLDITIKIMGGVSFKRGWFTAEAGPRFRTEEFKSGAYASAGLGMWVVPDNLAVNLYTNGNVNLIGGDPEVGSRELAYVQAAVFGTGLDALPGAGLQVAAGVIPLARNSARGYDLSASAFLTW